MVVYWGGGFILLLLFVLVFGGGEFVVLDGVGIVGLVELVWRNILMRLNGYDEDVEGSIDWYGCEKKR